MPLKDLETFFKNLSLSSSEIVFLVFTKTKILELGFLVKESTTIYLKAFFFSDSSMIKAFTLSYSGRLFYSSSTNSINSKSLLKLTLTNLLTHLGKVAEKQENCNLDCYFLILLMMLFTWYSKPISSIMSVSSNTIFSSVSKLIFPSSMNCSRRPGVATITPDPCYKFLIYICWLAPPYTIFTLNSWGLILSILNCSPTYLANSLVGVSTKILGLLKSTDFYLNFSSIGKAKAKVFPEPVLSRASTSFPWKIGA